MVNTNIANCFLICYILNLFRTFYKRMTYRFTSIMKKDHTSTKFFGFVFQSWAMNLLHLALLQGFYRQSWLRWCIWTILELNFPNMWSVILLSTSGDWSIWLKLQIIKINSPNQKDQYWNGKERSFGYKYWL